MTTLEPKALRRLASAWEAGIDSAERRNDAATFSGIVGDLAHRRSGGYHISREDQPASNYSVADCAEDRQGPSNLAAAVDMNMIERDMILVFTRLYRSWKDPNDPRLNHARGINGTLDGRRAIRIDCQFGTEEPSTDDHLWHVHLEVLRKYVEDDQTMRDILSVILDTTPEADMSLAEWTATPPADPNRAPFLTQGLPGYAGQQRDTALAFAWKCAADAATAAQACLASVAELRGAVAELAARPAPGTVTVTDEQLERVLRRVMGSVDGASPTV